MLPWVKNTQIVNDMWWWSLVHLSMWTLTVNPFNQSSRPVDTQRAPLTSPWDKWSPTVPLLPLHQTSGPPQCPFYHSIRPVEPYSAPFTSPADQLWPPVLLLPVHQTSGPPQCPFYYSIRPIDPHSAPFTSPQDQYTPTVNPFYQSTRPIYPHSAPFTSPKDQYTPTVPLLPVHQTRGLMRITQWEKMFFLKE